MSKSDFLQTSLFLSSGNKEELKWDDYAQGKPDQGSPNVSVLNLKNEIEEVDNDFFKIQSVPLEPKVSNENSSKTNQRMKSERIDIFVK